MMDPPAPRPPAAAADDAAPGAPSTSAAEPDAAAVNSAGLFRKRNRGANLRKRAEDEEDDDGDEGGGVQRKQKAVKGEPLAFSTKRAEKEELQVKYEGSRALQAQRDDLATRQLEIDTEADRDGRALVEKQMKASKAALEGGGEDDGKYKGMNSYVDYTQGFRREANASSAKATGTHGPLRGSAYMRVSARFDYQPDLCKDYKETGFCSYGDSCKFMHDRGDYKSGWELEKQWEEEQKKKAEEKMLRLLRADGGGDGEGDDGDGEGEPGDDLPFACFVCRETWEDCKTGPVVTRCRHYFCESCALKHNAKTGKCAVCEQTTSGIFNVAHDILKKMKKAKRG